MLLEEQLIKATHEADILNAEIPDPVIKYAPLLVGINDPKIKELAISLGSPEKIYLFVRDEIEYSENYDKRRTAIEVLESKQGDCLGQADLLAALLLAYGYTEEEVRMWIWVMLITMEKRGTMHGLSSTIRANGWYSTPVDLWGRLSLRGGRGNHFIRHSRPSLMCSSTTSSCTLI